MDLVEELMATRRWRNTCLRSNIVTPEKIEMWKKVKLAHVESNSPNTTIHDRRLREAISEIAPEWWGGRRSDLLEQERAVRKAY